MPNFFTVENFRKEIMKTAESLEVKFESMLCKLYPQQDTLKFKSGAYRNHETYRLYMAFTAGYVESVKDFLDDKIKEKANDY